MKPRPGPPSIWECRYFFRRLPARLSKESLALHSFRSVHGVRDRDTYLITGSLPINVKYRWRTNSLKIKRRLRSAQGGYELWQTVMDSRLPLSGSNWELLVLLLGLPALRRSNLSRTMKPALMLRVLFSENPRLVRWDVTKQRRFFVAGAVRMETAKIVTATRCLYSANLESRQLAEVRRRRDEVFRTRSGTVESYVSYRLSSPPFPYIGS